MSRVDRELARELAAALRENSELRAELVAALDLAGREAPPSRHLTVAVFAASRSIGKSTKKLAELKRSITQLGADVLALSVAEGDAPRRIRDVDVQARHGGVFRRVAGEWLRVMVAAGTLQKLRRVTGRRWSASDAWLEAGGAGAQFRSRIGRDATHGGLDQFACSVDHLVTALDGLRARGIDFAGVLLAGTVVEPREIAGGEIAVADGGNG